MISQLRSNKNLPKSFGYAAIFLLLLVSAIFGNVQNLRIPNSVEQAKLEKAAADAAKPPDPDQGLVLMTVSVAGPSGRPIPPIDRNRFHVLEDGIEQEIDYFWVDTRPITVGFVFPGASPSGTGTSNGALADVMPAFFETRIPEDEYFIEVFSGLAPVMVTPYTTDLKRAQKVFPAADGPPRLYDAVYLGLELIKEAANPRKILIVVSNGGDSGDGIHDLQIIAFAMKQPVQIYPITVAGEVFLPDVLQELAEVTGGHDYLVGDEEHAAAAAVREIARGTRTQYLIGYKAVHHDGKRRGLRVTVDRPEGSPKLTVWTKLGYVADKQSPQK